MLRIIQRPLEQPTRKISSKLFSLFGTSIWKINLQVEPEFYKWIQWINCLLSMLSPEVKNEKRHISCPWGTQWCEGTLCLGLEILSKLVLPQEDTKEGQFCTHITELCPLCSEPHSFILYWMIWKLLWFWIVIFWGGHWSIEI